MCSAIIPKNHILSLSLLPRLSFSLALSVSLSSSSLTPDLILLFSVFTSLRSLLVSLCLSSDKSFFLFHPSFVSPLSLLCAVLLACSFLYICAAFPDATIEQLLPSNTLMQDSRQVAGFSASRCLLLSDSLKALFLSVFLCCALLCHERAVYLSFSISKPWGSLYRSSWSLERTLYQKRYLSLLF